MPVLFAPFEKNFAGPTSKHDVKLTLADVHAIPVADRYWGMEVVVSDDVLKGQYILTKGHVNELLSDNANWKKGGEGSSEAFEQMFDADGVATDFTVNVPFDEVDRVSVNGQLQYNIIDYTVQNQTFTFLKAPISGKVQIKCRVGKVSIPGKDSDDSTFTPASADNSTGFWAGLVSGGRVLVKAALDRVAESIVDWIIPQKGIRLLHNAEGSTIEGSIWRENNTIKFRITGGATATLAERTNFTVLADAANTAWNCLNSYEPKRIWTVPAGVIARTLTLSNVQEGSVAVLKLVKTDAANLTITMAGAGLTHVGSVDSASQQMIIVGDANSEFIISFMAIGTQLNWTEIYRTK